MAKKTNTVPVVKQPTAGNSVTNFITGATGGIGTTKAPFNVSVALDADSRETLKNVAAVLSLSIGGSLIASAIINHFKKK